MLRIRLGRLVRRARHRTPWVLIWLCVLALVVRLTVRDHVPGLAALFYATPLPVIAGLLAAAAIGMWRRRDHRTLAASAAGSMAVAALWLTTSFYPAPPRPNSGEINLMLWNTAKRTLTSQGILTTIREESPDILVIIESGTRNKDLRPVKQALPQHEIREIAGNLLIAVRGTIAHAGGGNYNDGLKWAEAHVEVKGQPATLIVAHPHAHPMRPRNPGFRFLHSLLDRNTSGPVILAGDFNTPRDSSLLDPIRKRFTNAFETAGAGFIETWPAPLPLLALDQVWLSEGFRAVRCDHIHSWASDHKAVTVQLVPSGKPARTASTPKLYTQ